MAAFPPAARDAPLQQRFAPLGLLEPESPYVDPDPELAAALRAGLAADRERMEDALQHGTGAAVNGWKLTYHLFRLQPRLLRGRARSTTRSGSSPTPRSATSSAPSRRGPGSGATTATRPPTRWSTTTATATPLDRRAPLRDPLRDRAAGRRVLVDHDVRPARLLPRRERDRPLLDRRPHARPGTRDDGSLTIMMQRDAPADPTARANWLPDAARASSARSCACTSPTTPSSTAATSCRRSRGWPTSRLAGSSSRPSSTSASWSTALS